MIATIRLGMEEILAGIRFIMIAIVIAAGVVAFASAQPVATDHPACMPYRTQWNAIRAGSDTGAMDRLIANIPDICPNLKREARQRRAAVVVARPTAPVPSGGNQSAAQVELSFWRSCCEDRGRATAADYDAYLARYPRGQFADLARARTVRASSPRPSPPPSTTPASFTPGQTFRDCTGCPEMIVIRGGSFTMGSPSDEAGRADERPQHQVSIRMFAVAKYETTFDEWGACVRSGGCDGYTPRNHPSWGRENLPVVGVSWNDAKSFLHWIGQQSGKSYRLLTEAEWEYAARAGTTSPFSTGDTITPEQANFDGRFIFSENGRYDPKGTFRGMPVRVGSFSANAWGLFDMHGNVGEWTEDCHKESYDYAPLNGSAVTTGDCLYRVIRGGSWTNLPQDVRSAKRSKSSPSARSWGFRVARTI